MTQAPWVSPQALWSRSPLLLSCPQVGPPLQQTPFVGRGRQDVYSHQEMKLVRSGEPDLRRLWAPRLSQQQLRPLLSAVPSTLDPQP